MASPPGAVTAVTDAAPTAQAAAFPPSCPCWDLGPLQTLPGMWDGHGGEVTVPQTLPAPLGPCARFTHGG